MFLLACLTTPALVWMINRTPQAAAPAIAILRPDTSGQADAIVVLGAAVIEGCTLNMNGIRRVLLAARLYREGRAPLVFFTGGVSPGAPSCAVSDAMAQLAVTVGIPIGAIRSEATSTTTWENALHSAPHLEALGARRLLLVTDRLHMRRSEAAFARFGFAIERATVPMHQGYRDNLDMLYHTIRERAAYRYYAVRGWIANGSVSGDSLTVHDTAARNRSFSASPARYPGGPIVVLGASYAGGWSVPALAGVPLVNSGVTGQQSFEMLERFERDVVSVRPRAVIIWGFINDIFRTSRADVGTARIRTQESLRAIVSRAGDAGIEPILMTEVTIRHPRSFLSEARTLAGSLLGRSSYQSYVNGHVLELNSWVREFCRREGVLLLDIQPMFSTPDGRRLREVLGDGWQPHQRGRLRGADAPRHSYSGIAFPSHGCDGRSQHPMNLASSC